MRKFMKHEIKGTYRVILAILAIVIIASTIIHLSFLREIKNLDSPESFNGASIIVIILSTLVIFGAFLAAFLYIVNSFRKELYDNRGYLTFTLPLTGNQILASKLMVSMLWYGLLGLGIVLYNILLTIILHGKNWLEFLEALKNFLGINVFYIGLSGIISIVMTLILVYFAMALSRVSIKNKRVGGLWFVVFIVLNLLTSYLTSKVSQVIPYYLSLDGFKILHYNALNTSSVLMHMGKGSLMVIGNNLESYFNIFGNITQLGLIVGAFFATGYLIEKKIDL